MITPSVVVFMLLVNITNTPGGPPFPKAIPFVVDNLYSKENCESMAKIVKQNYTDNWHSVTTRCVMVRKAVIAQ